jgi:hypothetical protein
MPGDHVGRDVLRRPAGRRKQFARCDESGEVKVDDLDVAACVEEDVLEQRAAMRDALAVDVRDRGDDLFDDASNESVAVAHCRTEVRKQCVALRVLYYEILIQTIGQERVHVNDTGVGKLNDGAHLPVKVRERLLHAIELFGMVFTA